MKPRMNFLTRLLPIVILFAVAGSSAAEGRRATLSGSTNSLFDTKQGASVQAKSKALDSKIELSGYEVSIGRFSISLQREHHFDGHATLEHVRFFQGKVAKSRGRDETGSIAVVVAKKKKNGARVLELFLESTFSRRRKQLRSVDLAFVEKEGQFVVKKVRRVSTRKHRLCATEQKVSSKAAQKLHDDGVRTLSVREVELRIDGDVEYFSSIPNSVENMATMVAISDAFYRRDLGIGLIAAITETPQSYAALINYDENFNLDYFDVMPSDFAGDAFFVFTGKTPPSNDLRTVAGIANDLGVVCNNKSRSKGIVLTRFDRGSLSSFTAETLAHELGHTLSLTHDDNVDPNVGFLMNAGTNPNLSSFVSEFSSQSKAEAANHLATSGDCLAVGEDLPAGPPPPTLPPIITPNPDLGLFAQKGVFRKKAIIYGFAFDGNDPSPGVTLQIQFKAVGKKAKVVFTGTTDAFGAVSYFPRKLGKYFVTSSGLKNSRAVNVTKLKFK